MNLNAINLEGASVRRAAYRRVLASYVGMLRWQWFVGFYFVIFLVANLPGWLVGPGLLLWLSWFLTLHVSWRIQTARGRLVPGYREVHLAGLATVCGTLLLLLVGVMYLLPDEKAIAPAGLMLLAGAVGCWAALSAGWTTLLMLLMPATLLTRSQVVADVLSRWQSELANPWANLGLAGAAAILGAEFWRRFWALTENSTAAQLLRGGTSWNPWNLAAPWDARSRREVVRDMSRWAEPGGLGGMLTRRADARFDAALHRGSDGYFWPVRRWLLPHASVKFFVGAVLVTCLIVGWVRPAAPLGILESLAFFMSTVFVFGLSIAFLSQRRQFLAIESLRPVTRVHFFRQLGTGAVCQWGTVMVVLLSGIGWMARFGWAWPGGDWALADILAVLLGMLVIELATLLWVLRRFKWRLGGVVAAVGGLVVCCLMLAVVAKATLLPLSAGWLIFGAAVELAAGGLLLWVTYRRWLVADLD